MIIEKNQPVRFEESNALCSCLSKDSQPVQDADITEFQVKQDVCNFATNLITNGDFDDATGTGWTLSGFSFASDLASSTTQNKNTMSTSADVMGENVSYLLEIDINTNRGVPLLVYFGTNKIAEIVANGKFQLSGKCLSSTTRGELIIVSPQSNEVVLERVALYPLESDIGLAIYDVNDVVVDFRNLSDDTSDANYTFFRVDRDVITVSFPWDYITDAVNGLGLSRGCYYLGLSGECQNTSGQMGLFDPECVMPTKEASLSETTFPYRVSGGFGTTTMTAGTMVFLADATGTDTVTDVNFTPLANMKYQVDVNISAITNTRVTIKIGTDASVGYTTSGVKSFTLTAVDSTEWQLLFEALTGAGDTATIEYIRIKPHADSLQLVTSDFYTNMFDFKEAQSCTVLVAGANNEDAFDHRFESSQFVPKFRWKGTLRANKYDNIIEERINAFGVKKIDYFEERKLMALRLQNVPEYMVDFIGILRGFSQIYVDGLEYTATDDPDISYNRFCDRSKIELPLGLKRQDKKNINNKGLTAFTNINNILTRVVDEDEPLIWLDGDERAING